jgi:hypothetical protein
MGQAQANITTSNIPIGMADRTKTNCFSFDLTGGMVCNFDGIPKNWGEILLLLLLGIDELDYFGLLSSE